MLAQRFEDKTIEQLEEDFDKNLSLIISEGLGLSSRLQDWQNDLNDEDFTDLDIQGGDLVRRSREYIYPIRESLIYLGTKSIQNLNLKGETDIKFIQDLIKDWIHDILTEGLAELLSNPIIFYKGQHIKVNASKVRTLFRDILPNIYPMYFTSKENTYEVRLRQTKVVGVGTFVNIFLAYINQIRADVSLITPDLKREKAKGLANNTGEIYKLMSVGMSTIIDIEKKHTVEYNHTFRDSILNSDNSTKNYLDPHVKRQIFHKNIFRSEVEDLRQCPAAYSIYIIISKIVDALDDEFLMTPQEA